MVPLTLLVVLGATATLVAIGAADRTAGAYGEYFERAEVGDVVVNPSVHTTEIDRLIRSLPGVEHVTSYALFNTTLDDGAPRKQSEVETGARPAVFVYGSVDGRGTEMDRPALHGGRLPIGPNEALVSTEISAEYGIEVGDLLPLSFWRPGFELPESGEPDDEVVEPVGVERVEVVGIGTFPNEVLPEAIYPRGKLIVSPDVAARYACFRDVPPVGLSIEEFLRHLVPPDCARSYQYFSLDLADDAAGIPAALEAFLGPAFAPRLPSENGCWRVVSIRGGGG